jgi:integrase
MAYYRAYGTRNATEAAYKVKQLGGYFREMRLAAIDASAVLGYVAHRRAQGKAASTVNVELATLKKVLRLAQEHGKLERVPRISVLKPAPPRSGFFEPEQVEIVCRALSEDLALIVRLAFSYGWRVDSDILTLTKAQINLREGTLRLLPGRTKNGSGRVAYLTGELKVAIADKLSRVQALEQELSIAISGLFPHLRGKYRGQLIKSFVYPWRRACRQAGCEGMLRHDLRRSAARYMINLGVPERVVMAVTGHKTPSMLHRYCIVAPNDLQDVARRLSYNTRTIGHNLGTAGD